MLSRRFGASVLALLASVLALQIGVSSAAAEACAGAGTVDGADRRQATRAVLCLVNRARASSGLRALRLSRRLSLAARFHSADMVARGYFAHGGPAGDTVATRVRRAGYATSHPGREVGETLAWGEQATPDILVDALLRSPTHRRILMDPRADDAGIGLTPGAPAEGVSGPSSTLVLDIGA